MIVPVRAVRIGAVMRVDVNSMARFSVRAVSAVRHVRIAWAEHRRRNQRQQAIDHEAEQRKEWQEPHPPGSRSGQRVRRQELVLE